MEIRIKIDDNEFSNISDTRDKLLFEIYWEYDSSFYPTEHWVDFGCILLGWWVSAVVKLLNGDEESSFAFMDGPYSLLASFDRHSRKLILKPRGTDLTWKINIIELIEALSQAIAIVYEEFLNRGVDEKDKVVFRKYSKILQESLSELRKA